MGFTNLEAIPTFSWAHQLGMTPATLAEIEVRGESIASVKRNFTRPNLVTCGGGSEIYPAPRPHLELTSDGKGVVTWHETMPRPQLQYTPEHKAYVTWTNTAAGSPRSILERNAQLQRTGWVRVTPQTPGRYEFDPTQAGTNFFRLRKPY